MANNKNSFWDNFNHPLLVAFNKFRNGNSKPMNYRGSVELDNQCKIKLDKYKGENISMTDVIEAGKVRFLFENSLTSRGAVMIIARAGSVISEAAKLALKNDDEFPDFIQYIKDQVEQGNLKTLNKKYGVDVIHAILNH